MLKRNDLCFGFLVLIYISEVDVNSFYCEIYGYGFHEQLFEYIE